MADSSSVDVNVVTNAVDSSGATVISITQSNVVESSTVDSLVTTGGIGPTGATGATGAQGPKGDKGDPGDSGMLAATYDPQNIAADAFSRANHTGTQALATISDITASAAELNVLDGVTASTAELNYVDGVTSAIQTQLDSKATDTSVVHTTGVETVVGAKTWSDDAKFSGNVGIGVSGTILDKQHISTGYTRYSDTYGMRFGSTGAVSVTGSQAANTLSLTATTTTASGELRSTTAGTNAASVLTTAGTQSVTNKDLTSATNTFPTFNQNTTGSAAKLTTARNIAGVAFDGSAAISLTTGSSIQKANGSGGFTAATAGTDYLAFSGTTKISVGTSTPTSPTTGDLWVDTN